MSRHTILFPRTSFRAIEERYATWQTELLVRRATEGDIEVYDPEEPASAAAARVTTPICVVVTSTLIVPPGRDGFERLLAAIAEGDHDFAIPVTHDERNPQQHTAPEVGYLTLRQFEEEALRRGADTRITGTVWEGGDPALYVAKTAALSGESRPLAEAVAGKSAAVVNGAFFHRYAEHRGQVRTDLLERVPSDAKNILEFGCGEGGLGHALKQRQGARVVGIELDPQAAAIARTRLDEVHHGDVRAIVEAMDEQFDWIVGGDILEHLDEPWTFLTQLRRVAKPGGHLLLSLPNISSWPIVADLLRGRFDYVYMGILCAGHLRFYTKQNVRDMLDVAGWQTESIPDQEHFVTPEYEKLIGALRDAGIPHSAEDLLPPGHYVIARNG